MNLSHPPVYITNMIHIRLKTENEIIPAHAVASRSRRIFIYIHLVPYCVHNEVKMRPEQHLLNIEVLVQPYPLEHFTLSQDIANNSYIPYGAIIHGILNYTIYYILQDHNICDPDMENLYPPWLILSFSGRWYIFFYNIYS